MKTSMLLITALLLNSANAFGEGVFGNLAGGGDCPFGGLYGSPESAVADVLKNIPSAKCVRFHSPMRFHSPKRIGLLDVITVPYKMFNIGKLNDSEMVNKIIEASDSRFEKNETTGEWYEITPSY